MFTIIKHNSEQYFQMLELRTTVLRTPLGLTFSQFDLAADEKDILLGWVIDSKVVGCCILTEQSATIVKLRQMATATEMQGQQIGSQLLQATENWCQQQGIHKIELHARMNALPFYEKNNYNRVGEEFLEVTIPHIKMEKYC